MADTYWNTFEAIKSRVDFYIEILANHANGTNLLTQISSQCHLDDCKVLAQDITDLHRLCFSTFSGDNSNPTDPHSPRDQPLAEWEHLDEEFTLTHVKIIEILRELTPPEGLRLKLPKLTLPTFNGHWADWPSFKSEFNDKVNDSSKFPRHKKLHLLKEALTGPALEAIQDLQETDRNWDAAWDKLLSRYDSQKIAAYAAIKPLFQLRPMKKMTGDGIYHVLAEVRTAQARLSEVDLGTVTREEVIFSGFILAQLEDEDVVRFLESLPDNNVPSMDTLVSWVENYARSLEFARSSSHQRRRGR
ncbi:uncharacterized protein LOC110861010 [Folsomia candida]|uniref:Uncharacterized protein n=1 Tax=Folsomia candida TaxID=158441 RepID=A0A226D3R8_FOLCA|nr:uncharacterized protein LOC110861010 [Folsomia candida]OXA39823.1 hypothetical protein Fcan01_25505 [Folsomia candida]